MQVLWSNEQDQLSLPSAIDDLLHRVAARAAEVFNFPEHSELSIAFVDDAAISQLNQEYRGKAGPTDVLSFAFAAGGDFHLATADKPLLLGDIVISLERAAAQATSFGHSLEREIAFLLAHGLAHIAGLDHDLENEGEMKAVTEALLESVGVERSTLHLGMER